MIAGMEGGSYGRTATAFVVRWEKAAAVLPRQAPCLGMQKSCIFQGCLCIMSRVFVILEAVCAVTRAVTYVWMLVTYEVWFLGEKNSCCMHQCSPVLGVVAL